MNPTNEQELDEILRDNLTHDEYQYTEKPHRMKQAIIEWHSKQIEEVLDRLESKAAYDPSGTSPLINPREIEAERAKLREEK